MTPTRQRAVVITMIGLGLIIVGFFGLRTLHAFREFRGHRPPPFAPNAESAPVETDVELIRDWMTVPFIARMYHVPPPVIFEALGLPKDRKNEDKSLKQLNDEFFPDEPDHVITIVKSTVHANLPPPTAIPPTKEVPPTASVPPAAP